MFELNILILLTSSYTCGVNVQIDGKVDLGPKWSYEFETKRSNVNNTKLERKSLDGMPETISRIIEKYAPADEADYIMNHMFMHGFANKDVDQNLEPYKNKQAVTKPNKSTVHRKVTKPEEFITKNKEMYVHPRKVKYDPQIAEFTKHIYKQSIKVFDAIKQKISDETLRREVEFLAQSYEEKFGEFVRETQNQKIRTRLGKQKVIINTLETSNLILKRLVNHLIGLDKNVLRGEATANVYQNEVKKKIEVEKTHICKKFGICRTQEGFTRFIDDLITIALTASDNQIRVLTDAWTEVAKYADYGPVIDKKTQEHLQKGIENIESFSVTLLKAVLHILKNVLANKNRPIQVIGDVDERVNKTIATIEIIDAFENALPPDEKNKLEWEDIRASLVEWKDGKREDLMDIMYTLMDHLLGGIDKFGETTSQNFQNNINLIFG